MEGRAWLGSLCDVEVQPYPVGSSIAVYCFKLQTLLFIDTYLIYLWFIQHCIFCCTYSVFFFFSSFCQAAFFSTRLGATQPTEPLSGGFLCLDNVAAQRSGKDLLPYAAVTWSWSHLQKHEVTFRSTIVIALLQKKSVAFSFLVSLLSKAVKLHRFPFHGNWWIAALGSKYHPRADSQETCWLKSSGTSLKSQQKCINFFISLSVLSLSPFKASMDVHWEKLTSELEHPKTFRMQPSGQRLQQHTTYTFTPSHAEFILDHGASVARVNCDFFLMRTLKSIFRLG